MTSTRHSYIAGTSDAAVPAIAPAAHHNDGSELHPKRLGHSFLVSMSVLVIGAAVTFQIYHLQFSSHFDLFPGPRGDTRLTAFIVEHWYQVLSGHAHLMSPAMFYPIKGTLGYTDVHLAYVPIYSLLRLSGLDIFLALGLTVIIFCFLNFLSCFVLLRRVLQFNVFASLAGALFFAFNNPKLAQADHLQLQPVFLLPIIVGCLLVFFLKSPSLSEKKAFAVIALAAFCLNIQLLTSFYLGWFLVLWFFLLGTVSFAFRRSRLFLISSIRSHYHAFVGGTIMFSIGFIPFLVVYLPVVRSVGWIGLLSQYIPGIKSYLLMADGNYIWQNFTASILRSIASGPNWGRRVGIGLIPSLTWIGASLYSLWLIHKCRKMTVSTNQFSTEGQKRYDLGRLFFGLMILATNLFFIAGLQYRDHTLWNYIYLVFPGAKAIRAVARFVMVLVLPMSIAFSFVVHYGIEAIQKQRNRASRALIHAAIFTAVALGIFEQLNSGDGQYYSIKEENARLDKLAAKLPQGCSAFYVQASAGRDQEEFGAQNSMHDAMLVSLKRHIPTLNGRSGKSPQGWSLRDSSAPQYEADVKQWIRQNGVKGNVCRLEID